MSSPIYRPLADATDGILLSFVVDNSPDAVILLDKSYRLIYANHSACRLSHILPQHFNGPALWELYPEIVGTELERCYRAAGERGESGRIDSYFYEPFNTWFEIIVSPTPGGVGIYYRDITAIRNAELQRHDAVVELLRVLEATTDAVLTLDHTWRITYMNGNAKQLVASDREVLGTDVRESYPAAFY